MPKVAVLPPQYVALLQTLQAVPGRAAAHVAALPAEAQSWSPAPGEWNAPQVITHLAAADPHFLTRLQRIAKEDNPIVIYIGPTVAAPDDNARPADALVRLASSRQALLDFLTALPPADWARPAVHERTGPTTLALQVQVIVNHDNEHLGQLTALRHAWERKPKAA